MMQVKKNLFFNVISLSVNIIIAIFYTPYLVKNLGIYAYGVLPLAMIINQYVSILTTSLTGSLTRFYSVQLSELKYIEASKSLSSALLVVLGITVICIFFSVILISNIENVFSIPTNLLCSAKILFFFTFFGFFFSLISNFCSIVPYSENRLDLLKKLEILRIVSRVLLNIALFEILFVDIKWVGFATFLSELLVLIYSIYLFKRQLDKNVSIKISFVDKNFLSMLLVMTVWVIVHQIGDLGIFKTDVLFVNKFFGVKESGVLGIISDFGSYVMVLIGVLTSLFGPLILTAYANKNHTEVKELALKNSLLVGVLTSLIVGLLIGFSKEFLKLWLGSDFVKYSFWFQLKLLALPFYAASGVFAFVYRSWNKVKIPALITLLLGLFIIIISYILLTSNSSMKSEKDISCLIMISTIVCFLQTYVLGGFIFKKIYEEVSYNSLFSIAFRIFATMTVIILISKTITYCFVINNWLKFFLFGGIAAFLGILIISFFIINKQQQKYLLSILNRK